MSFTGSLATKCTLPNNETCIDRLTLIDLNPLEVNYYSFMISLDKWNGSCNVVDDLSTKVCVLSETRDANTKFFIW